MMKHLIVWILFVEFVYSRSKKGAAREYCLTEAFQADCSPNEVVIIDSAKYGRMKVGRCVTRNYGYIGCTNDVTEPLSWHCSGRQNCRLDNIATAFNDHQKSCPQDFKPYLEASFTCLKVESDPFDECPTFHYLALSHETGYLSSALAQSRGYGTRKCPWVISAQPGQYINITLHDWTHEDVLANELVDQGAHTSYCRQYAVVKERTEIKNIERCHGDTPNKPTYMSLSNRVEVELLAPAGESVPHYVLKYAVVGCPYPQAPADAYLQPQGAYDLEVRCNHTQESWTLTCLHGTWVGEIGNCTIASIEQDNNYSDSAFLPYGISVIIIFAVAVLICLTILSIGILHLKRRRRRDVYQPENLGVYPPAAYRSASAPSSPTTKLATIQRHCTMDTRQYGPCHHGYHPMTPRTSTLRTTHSRDGKYMHIWELRQQPNNAEGNQVIATATVAPQTCSTPQTPDPSNSNVTLLKRCTCGHPGNPGINSPKLATSPTGTRAATAAPSQQPPQMSAEPDVIQDGSNMPTSFSTFKPTNNGHIYESPKFDAKNNPILVRKEGMPPFYFELDSKHQNKNNDCVLDGGSV